MLAINCFERLLITIRAIKTWYDRLKPHWKSGILLLLKSVFVSLVLGALAPVATAVYAMKLGIRVPIEGVPYLAATISTWSFIAFLATAAALAFITAALLNMGLHDLIDRFFRGVLERRIRTLPPHKAEWARTKLDSVGRAFAVFGPITFAATYIVVLAALPILTDKEPSIEYYIAVFIGACILTAALVKIGVLTFFQVQMLYSVIFTFAMVVSLFLHDTYGSFLRVIRYGGGIQTTLQLAESPPREFRGYLLLQNDQVLVMMNMDGKAVTEVPVEAVTSRTVELFPSWKTPASNFGGQGSYLWFDPGFEFDPLP